MKASVENWEGTKNMREIIVLERVSKEYKNSLIWTTCS